MIDTETLDFLYKVYEQLGDEKAPIEVKQIVKKYYGGYKYKRRTLSLRYYKVRLKNNT